MQSPEFKERYRAARKVIEKEISRRSVGVDDVVWRDDRGLVQLTRWTNPARFLGQHVDRC